MTETVVLLGLLLLAVIIVGVLLVYAFYLLRQMRRHKENTASTMPTPQQWMHDLMRR